MRHRSARRRHRTAPYRAPLPQHRCLLSEDRRHHQRFRGEDRTWRHRRLRSRLRHPGHRLRGRNDHQLRQHHGQYRRQVGHHRAERALSQHHDPRFRRLGHGGAMARPCTQRRGLRISGNAPRRRGDHRRTALSGAEPAQRRHRTYDACARRQQMLLRPIRLHGHVLLAGDPAGGRRKPVGILQRAEAGRARSSQALRPLACQRGTGRKQHPRAACRRHHHRRRSGTVSRFGRYGQAQVLNR